MDRTFPIEWRNSLESAVVREFGQRGLSMHSGGSGMGGFDMGMHVVGTEGDDRRPVRIGNSSLEFKARADGRVRAEVVINYYDRGKDEEVIARDFGHFEWPYDPAPDHALPEQAREAAEFILSDASQPGTPTVRI